VVLAVTLALVCYPAGYAGARLFGFIVHYRWQGPDGYLHDELGTPSAPANRAFRPLVKLESRLRHFDEGAYHWD